MNINASHWVHIWIESTIQTYVGLYNKFFLCCCWPRTTEIRTRAFIWDKRFVGADGGFGSIFCFLSLPFLSHHRWKIRNLPMNGLGCNAEWMNSCSCPAIRVLNERLKDESHSTETFQTVLGGWFLLTVESEQIRSMPAHSVNHHCTGAELEARLTHQS